MNKNKISVYIICLNEEKHIQRALEAVKDFDEIIIVDSGSTDNTLEIAKQYTDKIYYKKWEGEGVQKAYALSLCSNEWVLNLDADEEIDNELKEEIKELSVKNYCNGLDIKFLEYYMGKKSSDLVKKNTHIRFFKKSQAEYKNLGVHSQVSVRGKINISKGVIHHFSDKYIHELVMKNNNYSTLVSIQKNKKNKKASFSKLILIFPLAFIKSFFLRRNIFNGKRGFIISCINAFYAFLKEAKLYELNNKSEKSN